MNNELHGLQDIIVKYIEKEKIDDYDLGDGVLKSLENKIKNQ